MSPKRSRLPGAHILLLAIVTLVGAVLAAAAEQGIAAKWSAAGGSVVKFSQDAVRNGFIASVLVVITWMIQEREKAAELVQEQRLEAIQLRQSQSEYVLGHGGSIALAVSGWSQVPKATAWDGPAQMPLSREALDDLSAEAEAWRALANRIEAITHQEIQSDNDIRSAYENLWAVPGYLTTYVAEGSRLRRLVYLGRLVDDLAVVETSPKSELAGVSPPREN